MKSINSVTLLGNLAKDPEIRMTESGKKVASFSLATDLRWKNKNGEEKKNTDFHRIIAFEGLGNICEKFLRKGSAVFVLGRLSNRQYEGKDGKMNYITEIIARDINIITWKNKEEGSQIDIEKVESEEIVE
ncbi:single-stranded DNA-binding protein [Candidatus Peregrinibacteria bacterium]|nr:single-stranded DNA-binding protein [Candidatus Peregrinibacteria bacterium]